MTVVTREQMNKLDELLEVERALNKEIRNTAHLLSKEEWAAIKQRRDDASAQVQACMEEMGFQP